LAFEDKSFGAKKRRWIDQFARLDPGNGTKEAIHDGKPSARMGAEKAGFGNSEISEQPSGIWNGSLSQFCNDAADLLDAETIEKEMGDDQIVTVVRRPSRDIVLQKSHATDLVRHYLQNMTSREFEHSFAAVNAIDPD